MKELIESQIQALTGCNLGLLTGKEVNGINAAINRLNLLINNPLPTKYEITNCSPKALGLIVDNALVGTGELEQLGINGKYPFGQLLIGQSFVVPYSEGRSRGCLDSCQRSYTQRTGKRFRVVNHAEFSLFEVVRLS